jgi:hypothetical protein
MLARHARKLLNLVDDTPIVPGDAHPAFTQVDTARDVLNDAEDELRSWTPNVEPIHTNASGLGVNAMPSAPVHDSSMHQNQNQQASEISSSDAGAYNQQSEYPASVESYSATQQPTSGGHEPVAFQNQSDTTTTTTTTETPYPTDEREHDHARDVAARVVS